MKTESTHLTDVLFPVRQGSTFTREALAGVTTFLTMAYILFVQPAVLSQDYAGQPTGLDPEAVLLATCLSAAFASALMGIFANYPIALAPGMGQNFFFVSVVVSLTAVHGDRAWQAALGIVFVAGVLFLLLSLIGVREALLHAMSPSMRNSIAVGIGLFIALIGLRNGGVIVAAPGTLVRLNPQLINPQQAVFWTGLLTAIILHVRRVRGDILWGILSATIVAACAGQIAWPARWVGFPEVERSAILQMDIVAALQWVALPYVFVFLFMDVFDTMGTLIGVAQQAGLMRDGRLPRARQAMLADAAGTVMGACLGTSTVTSYIESAAGVQQGGRTGLTSLTVSALFLAALGVAPLIGMIGGYAPITAPALVLVGALMVRNVVHIDWSDASEAIPAFLTMAGIPFCFSIADGLSLGLITYPIIKLLGGRGREVQWLMYVLAAVLLVYFVLVRSRLGGG